MKTQRNFNLTTKDFYKVRITSIINILITRQHKKNNSEPDKNKY